MQGSDNTCRRFAVRRVVESSKICKKKQKAQEAQTPASDEMLERNRLQMKAMLEMACDSGELALAVVSTEEERKEQQLQNQKCGEVQMKLLKASQEQEAARASALASAAGPPADDLIDEYKSKAQRLFTMAGEAGTLSSALESVLATEDLSARATPAS
mmetsp:Transcript_53304/g.95780  ORF Transcript_53304/g.95780 Transcript_53304/m.95780 type:complete len:158 (+) Transcript_53304:253-726(+)